MSDGDRDSDRSVTVACSKVGMTHVIGKGGATIKAIQAETGAKLDTTVDDADTARATIRITGPDAESVAAARRRVETILAEQENPDYEGPEGTKLRAQADAHAAERSRLMTLADEQFAAGDKAGGHASMAQAKDEGAKMKQAAADAAQAILAYNNDGKGDGYLDLHGLRVAEAEAFVTERIDALEAKDDGTDLELIPGAGHHSAPGKVALKPAVEALLDNRGVAYEQVNAGTLLAHVKGIRGTTAAASTDGNDKPAEADGDERAKAEAEPAAKKEDKGGCCVVM